MRRLLEATAITGVATVVAAVLGLGQTKVLAVFLGPAGVGALGMLINYVTLSSTAAQLGTASGAIKFVSEYRAKADTRREAEVILGIGLVVMSLTVVAAAAGAAFADPLAKYLGIAPNGASLVVVASLAIPAVTLWNLLGALLNGYERITALATVKVATAAFSLGLVFPAVFVWGLMGALWVYLLGAVLASLLYLRHLWVKRLLPERRHWRIEGEAVRKVLRFGLMSLLPQLLYWAQALVLLWLLTRVVDLGSAGLYMATVSIVGYLTLLQSITAVYLFPKMSREDDPASLGKDLNDAYRLSVLLLTVGACLLVVGRELVISGLYSPKFAAVAEVLPWAAMAAVVGTLGFTLTSTLLAREKLLAYGFVTVSGPICAIVVAALLIPAWGLFGAVAAYMVNQIAVFALASFTIGRAATVRVSRANYLLLASGLLAVFLVWLLRGELWAQVSIVVAWGLVVLTPRERAGLWAIAAEAGARIRVPGSAGR